MTDRACPEGFRPNPGHLPADAVGKRVAVALSSGILSQSGWPADGPAGCSWAIKGSPFDIVFYRVLG